MHSKFQFSLISYCLAGVFLLILGVFLVTHLQTLKLAKSKEALAEVQDKWVLIHHNTQGLLLVETDLVQYSKNWSKSIAEFRQSMKKQINSENLKELGNTVNENLNNIETWWELPNRLLSEIQESLQHYLKNTNAPLQGKLLYQLGKLNSVDNPAEFLFLNQMEFKMGQFFLVENGFTILLKKSIQTINYEIEKHKQWNLYIAFFISGVLFSVVMILNITVERKNRLLNTSLEEKVRQRTEDLKEVNEKLELKVEERTKELKRSLKNLRQTQKELIHSEKMASLGSIVAGVTHEIATPLGIVRAETTYLEAESKEVFKLFEDQKLTESKFKAFIDIITEVLASILRNSIRVTDQLKSFKEVSVDQTSDRSRSFNAKLYIEEILLNLHAKLKKTRHKITINCPENLVINSFPGAFSQIITNFIINTLQHGFVGIEEGNILIDLQVNNKKLLLKYKDNGIGMDEKTAQQIFDPFFTTKRNEGGSGLGMNIVYIIVTQKLNGQIKCFAAPGEGTEFIVEIPISL